MPLYEYKCETCDAVFEVIQKFSDDPLAVHESCGGRVQRLVSCSSFQFKGSGWYITDYAKKGRSKGSDNGKSESTGESKSESKGESKGELKSESKGESKSESRSESKGEKKSESKGEKKADSSPSTTPAKDSSSKSS